MKLEKMPKEELELLSYTDLTNLILKESKKPLNTAAIFKIIADLLDYSEDEYMAKIGDFYTSLTLDKRFVLLDTEWDLATRHAIKLEIDDDDESEEEEETEEEDEDETEEDDSEIEDVEESDDLDELDDDIDDDLDDLSLVDEEEIDEES